MAKQYRTGIIITGDPSGGVRAIQLTEKELKNLNATQTKGRDVQKKSRQETDESSKSMTAYAGKLGLVSAAVGALTAVVGGLGISAIVRDTVAATKETTAWANALGLTSQELQAVEFAAQSAGLAQGKMADLLKDVSEKVADSYTNGAGEAVEALENLNLTAAELVNLSPDQQLLKIASGLDAVGSNAAKIQILESLASDASLLLPLLDDNAKKFRALRQEAIDTGVALSNIDTAKIAVIDEQFRTFSASTEGLGKKLTAALSPAIYGVSQEIDTLIEGWGGLDNIAQTAVDGFVSGISLVLDVGQELLKWLKISELGWLSMGMAGIDAFINAGQAGVDIINTVLTPFKFLAGEIITGYGKLIGLAGKVTGNRAWEDAANSVLKYAERVKAAEVSMDDFIYLQTRAQEQFKKTNEELQDLINASAPSDVINQRLEEANKEIERMAQANLDAAASRQALNKANGDAVNKAKDLKKETADLKNKTKELADTAAPIAQIYKDTASSIRGAFSGAFRDLLDGQNSFADRLKNSFKDMLADMATLAIANPIIIPMTQSLGGVLGVPGAAQAGVIAQLGGGYAGLQGQQAAMLAAQTADFGAEGAVLTAQAAGGSGLMESIGATIGAGFMGYMAGGVAADIFDVANPKMSQALTAVGAMIAGPIGGAVGFAVGSLFGGKWQTSATGFNLNFSAGAGVTGTQFQEQIKKGGLFSSDKSRTLTEGLDVELAQTLNLAFTQVENTLVRQLDSLNIVLNDNLDGLNTSLDANYERLADFTASTVLDTTNLNLDQIESVITNWVGDVSTEMAAVLLPGLDAFRRAGETGTETIQRLTSTLTLMTEFGRDLDLTIVTLNHGAESVEQFAARLGFVAQDINSTLLQLGQTSDMQERIELEQQLADQVVNRYQLELEFLQSLQQAVTSISTDIATLQSVVAGNIASITGPAPVRSAASIASDLAGITVGSADGQGLAEYQSLVGQIAQAEILSSDLLAHILDFQNQIAELEANSMPRILAGFAEMLTYESLKNQLAPLLVEYESALENLASLQTAADAALLEYNESLSEFLGLTADQVTQLQSLREETLNYYNAMLQLDNAMTGAAANLGNTLESLRLGALSPAVRLNEQLDQFSALTTAAASATGFDLVTISEQLNALVNPLLSGASGLFASGQGYQDVFNQIVSSLADVQQRLIDEAPQGYEQSSLTLLTSIDTLLGDLQNVLSAAEQAIVDAIDTSRLHTVATLEDIRLLLGGEGRTLASFDTGSGYVPRDMLANVHQGEIIFDPQTSSALRRYGIPASTGNPKMLESLRRIESLLSENSGDLRLTVVTPDGKILKEETITDIKKRSSFGEAIIHANGVFA